ASQIERCSTTREKRVEWLARLWVLEDQREPALGLLQRMGAKDARMIGALQQLELVFGSASACLAPGIRSARRPRVESHSTPAVGRARMRRDPVLIDVVLAQDLFEPPLVDGKLALHFAEADFVERTKHGAPLCEIHSLSRRHLGVKPEP